MTPRVVGRPDAVTPDWLTEVLRADGVIGGTSAVASLRSNSIGTGQVGDNVRFEIDYDGPPGPASVVCKFGSSDPASAAAGVSMHLYETEVAFYTELADTVDVARPHCFFAAVVPGTADAVLVMEDLAPAVQGDQISGCSVEEAERAVDEAARLHGPRWGDPSLADMAWLAREGEGGGLEMMVPFVWDSYVERYQSAVLPVTHDAAKAMAELGPLLAGRPGSPRCPTHYDFRLDNMLFGAGGGKPIAVVDWQTVQLAYGPRDVAYFLGNAFEPEVRRGCERELVARYHRALVEDYGVADYSLDECWADYVSFSYSSMAMAVFASMVVGRTDRGDAMFMAMANRSAQMAADLDAAAVIRSR